MDTTATLPRGWRRRLIEYANENTGGVTTHCLEPHDLIVSKLVAGRTKDHEFTEALFGWGLVDPEVVKERLAETDVPGPRHRSARVVVDRLSP